MAGLLDKFFFPKWLQVLALWLNHSPNYDQVTNWYMGWKSMLSEKILAEPLVKGACLKLRRKKKIEFLLTNKVVNL